MSALGKYMKIENIADFINEQIEILRDLEKLKEFYSDSDTPFEHEKIELYIFSSLLLCGVKGKISNGNVVLLTGTDFPLTMNKAKLDKNPFLRNILNALPMESVVVDKTPFDKPTPFKKDEADSAIGNVLTVPKESIKTTKNDTTVQAPMPDSVGNNTISSEQPVASKNENVEEKTIDKPTIPAKTVLRLKDIPKENAEMSFAEGAKYKFYKTMWMQQLDITYSEEASYCEETFTFTLYPLALNIERMSLPMLCIIQHENAKRYVFSDELKSSIEISIDEFQFGISLCFKEGKLSAIITQFNGKYQKMAEKIISDQQGELIPSCFGKKMIHGSEWVEIYPIGIENDQQTGLVPFVYRALTADGMENGLSDYKNEALVAFSGGAHSYGAYWTMDDSGERQLIVEEV